MIAKEQFLQFLDYIRNKEDVFVDELVTTVGLLNRQQVDKTPAIKSIVKGIRKVATLEDAYVKVYTSLMNYTHENNPHWKERPDLLFFEDVYEFFLAAGKSPKKAEEYTRSIASGTFKSKCNASHEYLKLFGQDKTLIHWATNTKWLPHRSAFVKLLPTEYARFLNECRDQTCECKELPGLSGNWLSASKYLYHRLQYNPMATLDLPHKTISIPCGILMLPASFKDAHRLYYAAKEWFPFKSEGSLFENVVSVGLFNGGDPALALKQKPSSEPSGTMQPNLPEPVFNRNSLCLCTTALRGDALRQYCENVLLDLDIPSAYLKDGFSGSIFKLSAR